MTYIYRTNPRNIIYASLSELIRVPIKWEIQTFITISYSTKVLSDNPLPIMEDVIRQWKEEEK